MNRILIKEFGHDNKGNVVVVLFSEDETELNDLVAFNPDKSLQTKNVIFKVESEEPKHATVYLNPFVTVETFMEALRESYSGEIYFSSDARKSYVSAINNNSIQKVYTFDETMKKESPIFGS
jgi:hypothetical protein